jgi:Na+-translocating ferredoxin:NAD+ oxidoreductase RnfD subunit
MTTFASAAAPAVTPRRAFLPFRLRPLRVPRDPRGCQIAVLAGLLGWGLFRLQFDLRAPQVLVTLGAALVTQLVCTRLARLETFDPKSALISGLSLCLLLRTDHLALAALAAIAAIASKFVLRADGRHVFNPTNFGITVLLAVGAPVWVSPGQWGSVAFFAFLMACLGGLVVNRAARGDVTLAFLGCYAAILFGRALWLGQRAAIPLHQLQGGALLLFAFFMISDPKTTPRSRAGRVLFAALVASCAASVQFLMYRTNGLLWSLVALSPLVPLINRLLPGPRYEWSRPVATRPKPPEGDPDETLLPLGRAVPGYRALAGTRA